MSITPVKPLFCRKCNTEEHIILGDAGLVRKIEYWYCKKCKIEIDTAGYEVGKESSPKDSGLSELEDYLEEVTEGWDSHWILGL